MDRQSVDELRERKAQLIEENRRIIAVIRNAEATVTTDHGEEIMHLDEPEEDSAGPSSRKRRRTSPSPPVAMDQPSASGMNHPAPNSPGFAVPIDDDSNDSPVLPVAAGPSNPGPSHNGFFLNHSALDPPDHRRRVMSHPDYVDPRGAHTLQEETQSLLNNFPLRRRILQDDRGPVPAGVSGRTRRDRFEEGLRTLERMLLVAEVMDRPLSDQIDSLLGTHAGPGPSEGSVTNLGEHAAFLQARVEQSWNLAHELLEEVEHVVRSSSEQ